MTTTALQAEVATLRALPHYAGYAQWALEATAECAIEGHTRYVDGRCVRCRAYEPAKPEPIMQPTSQAELDLIRHRARMRRMMDTGDSHY